MDRFHHIYTFVDNDGTNIHIDSTALREWCLSNKDLIVYDIPMKRDLGLEFLRDNVISLERIKELISKQRTLDPIIMCKDGTYDDKGAPNVLIVDGHHRYFLACLADLKIIPGYCLEVEQWKPFIMEGLPKLTQDQLRKAPIIKRNY